LEDNRLAALMTVADPLVGGWLLGTTIAAMLLGHWYLNTPTMQLAPLRRLLVLMGSAVVLRAAFAGAALALQCSNYSLAGSLNWALLAIRWLAGIAGTALLAKMAWQTLKIPNTQSATGILYIAVMFTFIGELAGLLLSASTVFPL
jgi:hypothetical protein